MSFDLTGRTAVVIGGTGVLGLRIATALGSAGARVVVSGRDQDKGDAALETLESAGIEARFVPGNAAERAQLVELRDRSIEEFGGVDVLVNAAGVNSATPFLDIDDDEMERIVAINQLAVVRACQVFGEHFVERSQGGGSGASIVNVGSASGLTPLSRVFTYSMTKAAVHNLTKNLAREWGPLGIRVNVLVPGFFPAEQNRAVLTPDRVDAIIGHTPLGRFGEPSDLDGAVVLLASDAGRFITGTELVVDGGFSAMTI